MPILRKNKLISRKTLEIKDKENTPCYLSLNCLKLKGDDSLRDYKDKLRCADCPVKLADFCDECRNFIEYLGKKLGISQVEGGMVIDEWNWTHLDSNIRAELFERILNNGIIIEGRVPFKGLSKFSTWAHRIYINKISALSRVAKYEHDNILEDVYLPNPENPDGSEQSWEVIVSNRYHDIEPDNSHILDEMTRQEIRKVILLCHERIYKQDKWCGELMVAFCNQSLEGMEEDEAYTFTSSDELNKTPVYNALAVRFGATFEMVRGWLRNCNDKHLTRLRRCLQEHGYGLEFVVG